MEKKVLFVCHVASLSGAPILLLDIIREFKQTSNIPFAILVVKDGPLTAEFRRLGRTYIWESRLKEPTIRIKNRLINLFRRINRKFRQARIRFAVRDTSLVFLNTMANGAVQKKLLSLQARFVCYVHEMRTAIHIITGNHTLEVIKANTHLFIACSAAVKRDLMEHTGINEHAIRVFNTPVSQVRREKKDYSAQIAAFKQAHNIPPDAVLVGAVGSNNWRKGFDLLFPLVAFYYSLFPDANTWFVWKGYDYAAPGSWFELHDRQKQPFRDRIILAPHDAEAIAAIAAFDIHLLLSREDPYPLVLLETASFGIPTVCFADAGGAAEFIGEDAGKHVPYGDLKAMAEALHTLAGDPATRSQLGQTAQARLAARHAKERCMPAFMNVLEEHHFLPAGLSTAAN